MGLRSRLRASSSSGRSPSPNPTTYAPLPPNAAEIIVLTYSQPAPAVVILSQAIDGKPLFQINYSTAVSITNIQTGEQIGTIGFNSHHMLCLSQLTTSTNIAYKDTLVPPPWFRSVGGNELYWRAPAYNPYQATLWCQIVDGRNYEDEEDVAVAVILDSKWKKGRIEFRKRMGKDEMDFLLLSAIAEIEDLRGKVREGQGAASAGGSTASQAAGYLKVAAAGAKFAQAVSGGGGGA